MNRSVTSSAIAVSIDDAEIVARKAFLESTDADIALLEQQHANWDAQRNSFRNVFYRHWQHFPQLPPLLGNAKKLERPKLTKSGPFKKLTEGEYGSKYAENGLLVWYAYEHIGLAFLRYNNCNEMHGYYYSKPLPGGLSLHCSGGLLSRTVH